MRGKFLSSKEYKEEGNRAKHLVEFEDGTFSVLYSPYDIIFKEGEEFNIENGKWKSDDYGILQMGFIAKMSEEDARREFKR